MKVIAIGARNSLCQFEIKGLQFKISWDI